MTSRERVLRAIYHLPVDRVPKGELCIEDQVIRSLLGVREIRHLHRRQFVEQLGLDLICLTGRYPKSATSAGVPDPDRVDWLDLERWVAETDLFPLVLLEGTFTWGVRQWGFEQCVLKLMRDDQDVYILDRKVRELNVRLAQRAWGNGAEGIVLAEDIAYQKGPIFHPEILRTTLFPSFHWQVNRFKAMGMHIFFHSDGNLERILKDIVDCGFDGLQCIEEAAGMDLKDVKKRFGKQLCLWGNLDPDFLTQGLGKGVVEDKVHQLLSEGASGSGFIFGTSSGLFKGVRAESAYRVYSAADGFPAASL